MCFNKIHSQFSLCNWQRSAGTFLDMSKLNTIPGLISFQLCPISSSVSRCYAAMYRTRSMSVEKGSLIFFWGGKVSYYLPDKRGQKAVCLVEYRKAQSWTQEVKSARREKEKSGGGGMWHVEVLVKAPDTSVPIARSNLLARKVAEQRRWSCFADVTFRNPSRNICWHRRLAYMSMTCVIVLVLPMLQIGGPQDVQHSLFYSILMRVTVRSANYISFPTLNGNYSCSPSFSCVLGPSLFFLSIRLIISPIPLRSPQLVHTNSSIQNIFLGLTFLSPLFHNLSQYHV